MNAVKVDETRRVQLPMLTPGDYFEPQNVGTGDILLHKVPVPRRRRSKPEVLAALDKSPIKFTVGWDELKASLR